MADDKPIKLMSFKDMHNTEYRPGEDDLTNYRAYRRKRTSEEVDNSRVTLDDILEALSVMQRKKKARLARGRVGHRMKLGSRKAKRRMADTDRLKTRARRQAIRDAKKKLLKGKKYSEISDAQKAAVERRLSQTGWKQRLALKSRRLVPGKRRSEIARKK